MRRRQRENNNGGSDEGGARRRRRMLHWRVLQENLLVETGEAPLEEHKRTR